MRMRRLILGAAAAVAAAKVAGDLAVREHEDVRLDDTVPPGQLASIEGLRFHYLDTGAGPALVLLHGLASSTFDFRHNIEALSRRFRVIVPDLAGHGLSTRSAPDLSLEAQARYVGGLLDHLGVERFSLAGHSMGGSIAQRMALQWPERVERLVLIASTTDEYMLRATWASPLVKPFIPLFVSVVVYSRVVRDLEMRLLVAHPEHLTPATKASMAAPGHIRGHTRSYQRLMADRRKDRKLDLAAIRQPTLLLWGDSDRLVDIEHGRRLERGIPGAKLAVVSDAGHLLPEEQSETVNRLVMEFLEAGDTDTAVVGARARV